MAFYDLCAELEKLDLMIKPKEAIRYDAAGEAIYTVESLRSLTDSAYILRINRNGIDFTAGQHILLGEAGSSQMREYSIYSGEQDDFLEVLVREVEGGLVSKKLKRLKVGDAVQIEPPVGFFILPLKRMPHDRFLFLASGTGIAPFHSMIRSNPDLDYTLIHGVRHSTESFGMKDYDPAHYILCTSRDDNGQFRGRLTDYLRQHPDPDYALIYLCGNYDMILDAMDILRSQGYKEEQMVAEVYF